MHYDLVVDWLIREQKMTTNEFTTVSGKYLVKSFGNGWAYEITLNGTDDTLFFQDDDANQLRNDSDDFMCESVIDQYFDCLCE